jgi:hypothetical protein
LQISNGDDRMLVLRGLRTFSLSASRDVERISCDGQGAFAGGVPLLKRVYVSGASSTWAVRPVAELNDELTARYRLPIDVAAKAGALALIANALNGGDLAMAAIATVQMQFPNPPSLAKGIESADDIMRRALELRRSRLLKANWDPARHPRAGAPPNPGWFAPVPTGSEAANVVPAAAVGNPWDKPVILEGGGGGGVPRGTLELPFPRGLPRFLSPGESAPEPPPPPESVAPPESLPQARRLPKLPPPPPPGPRSGSDDDCFDRYWIEYGRCDIFAAYSPRYRDACRVRATDRLRLCLRNGGKPDPDEPPEFDWNDIPGDPATR